MKRKEILCLLKKDELFLVRLMTFLALLIPFIMSPKVWFSQRMFPLVPVFDNMPIPSYTVDIILITGFFLLLFLFIFNNSWKIGILIILIYVFWALLDQNRIQPFYFEIIFMVLALSYFKDNPTIAKQCILLILIGTYFWSGVHKYNDLFFEKWGNGLSKRIPFAPLWMRQIFTYAVPFLEASFGFFLIFTRTRKLGIWLITLMHAMILTTLIYGRFSYVVFPLTIFNVFVLFYLFYNNPFSVKEIFNLRHPKSVALFLIAIVFPMLNFLGLYDHILAFSYFSAKPKYCRIHFSKGQDLTPLPDFIKQNVRALEGQHYIDLNEWGGRTIQVLIYPETRVYVKIQKFVDSYLENPNTHLEFY